jgi:glyoxylase-like metal-dependent hydrolase (beta-lactamase superfamily II)
MIKVMIAPVTPFQQNCSIVWCQETMEGTAVDPGGDFDVLKEATTPRASRSPSPADARPIRTMPRPGTMAGPLRRQDRGPHKDDLYLIEGLPESGPQVQFSAYKPFVPDRWLENGETVQPRHPHHFDVAHRPGHTPGHVVFVHQPSKVAFVGDVLFRGSIRLYGFPAR